MTLPKKPLDLGPGLNLSDERVDQEAEVTAIDVASAQALWIRHAPKALRDLLDARRD